MPLFILLPLLVVFLAYKAKTKLAAKRDAKAKQLAAAALKEAHDEREAMVQWSQHESTAAEFVVKHLFEGKATVLLRERPHLKKCTGHMIIWAGKKRKRKDGYGLVMIEDSHYDLGVIDEEKLSMQVVDEYLLLADNKLKDLVQAGTLRKREAARKRRGAAKSSASKVELPALELEAANEVIAESATDDSEAGANSAIQALGSDPTVKLRAYPSIFRGTVLALGMLEKTTANGPHACYGLRYRQIDGKEDTLWGVALKTACSEAGVAPGDDVEVMKLGRKSMEEGKAPMNLYQVAKLSPGQLHAH